MMILRKEKETYIELTLTQNYRSVFLYTLALGQRKLSHLIMCHGVCLRGSGYIITNDEEIFLLERV